jgi:peptide/nickel transport system ATP-binding protein
MENHELVLEVRNLRTFFKLEEGMLKAVNDVSFSIGRNRTLGIVGESGCGKSVTAQSILRIVPPPGKVSGSIILHRPQGTIDLAEFPANSETMRDIRGKDIAMVFQEPMTAFSPIHTIGEQIAEAIMVHEPASKAEARGRAIEMLTRVGISNPGQRFDEYAYQLSGGMRQRAMIAMGLILKPMVLIADEPTTALDVTIQAQILRLMKDLQAEMGMSIIFITHNLGVIANMANDVAVMYLGRVVEYGSVYQVFNQPLHPYTQALMRSIPKVGRKMRERLMAISGNVPVPINPPETCPFAPRCGQFIKGRCDAGVPDLIEAQPGHQVRCVLYENKS